MALNLNELEICAVIHCISEVINGGHDAIGILLQPPEGPAEEHQVDLMELMTKVRESIEADMPTELPSSDGSNN